MTQHYGQQPHQHHDKHHHPVRDFQLPANFGSFSPAEVTEFVRSLLANDPTMLPGSVKFAKLTADSLDAPITPDMLDGVDGSGLVGVVTDGIPVSSSPTPTVTGGLGMLFVKWTAVTNADAVGYEVHVSTTTGFTPSSTTLSQKIVGTLATIRALPDGTPLDYTTTYYVKLVAFDDDGPAAAGAQASGSPVQVTGPDIAANAVTAAKIAAGEITAAKLESFLILATTIATAASGARVKIDPTGIRLYDSTSVDDTTGLTMVMDAQSGSVSIRGQFDFGADPNNPSRLSNQDVIDIVEQATGFQTPGFVRSIGQNYSNNGSTSINQSLAGSSTAGNLLVMTVTILKHTGTPQTITSAPSGWAQIATNLQGQLRQYIYKFENAPKKTSVGAFTLSAAMGVNDIMRVSVGEFSGCQVGDVNSSGKGNSTSLSSGVTGAQAQAQNLVWGTLAYPGALANMVSNDLKLAGSAVTGRGFFNGAISPSNSGSDVVVTTEFYYNDTSGLDTTETVATLNTSLDWIASVISFKAKTATGTPATPDAGRARLYSTANAATKAQLHQIDDAGVANSLTLAPSGASWRMEYVTASVNLPSTAAHSSMGAFTVSIPGLAVGDLCILIGKDGVGRNFILQTNPLCSTAGQIDLIGFNADSAVSDPAATTYHFLVIHIT